METQEMQEITTTWTLPTSNRRKTDPNPKVKTEILTMKTTKARKNNIPPPFDKIEYKTEGKVLGKQIQMKTTNKHH